MAEDKKSFILYSDILTLVEKLPDAKAGKLFKLIIDYVNDKNPVVEDLILQVAFEPIKMQLKRDLKKFESKKEQWSDAGKKSAESRRKKREEKNKKPTELTNVKSVKKNSTDSTVTVNDTVTVTDSDSERKEQENFRAPDLSKSNLFRQPVIPTKNEVLESFLQNGGNMEMAKSFWERNEATGWYFKGSPITNFRNMVASYVTNWNKNNSGKKEINHADAAIGQKIIEEQSRAILNC